MRTHIALAVALAMACTPPPIYKEGYEPIVGVTVGTRGPPGGLGASGAASAPAGIALFSSSNQTYQALAELIGGPLGAGVSRYRTEVSGHAVNEEQARAIEVLQRAAERSALERPRPDGGTLVRVRFYPGPPERDGSFLLRAESVIESKQGVRHREVRDAIVRPRADGPPSVRWIGPPEVEP